MPNSPGHQTDLLGPSSERDWYIPGYTCKGPLHSSCFSLLLYASKMTSKKIYKKNILKVYQRILTYNIPDTISVQIGHIIRVLRRPRQRPQEQPATSMDIFVPYHLSQGHNRWVLEGEKGPTGRGEGTCRGQGTLPIETRTMGLNPEESLKFKSWRTWRTRSHQQESKWDQSASDAYLRYKLQIATNYWKLDRSFWSPRTEASSMWARPFPQQPTWPISRINLQVLAQQISQGHQLVL